jgi:uncharacterized protein (TIGR02001 family)
MKKLSLAVIIALASITTSSTAMASEIGVGGKITGMSNYVFRGVTQTSDKAAVSAEVFAGYENFFAGLWASNVDFDGVVGANIDANIEVDYYVGYENSIKDLSYILSYARYTYPGSDMLDDFDEAKVEVSYPIGKLTLGGSYALGTWNENGNTKLDNTEFKVSYNFDIFNLNLAAGSYEKVGDYSSIGLSKAGKFAGKDLELKISYANFDSDNGAYPYQDDDHIFAEVVYSF